MGGSFRILSILFYFTIIFLGSCQAPAPQNEAEHLQNIVFIIGDDHAAYALGCYGNSHIRTPNLDKMARKGQQFLNAFANAPLCSASRQSILTGRYPHAAGVTLLRTSFPEEQVTIAEHLKEQGYKTGVIGKTHFNNNGSHGFDYKVSRKDWQHYVQQKPATAIPAGVDTLTKWKPFRDPARIWLNADQLPTPYFDEDMEGSFYAQKAGEFLEKNMDSPFCLWIGFHEPHSPFNFPVNDTAIYEPKDMPMPSVSPEDDRWVPAIFKDLSEADKRGIIASYYTSVEHLDKNVGIILDKIEGLGLEENTLVVYVGDQGYLLGHHKRFEKHMMWDEANRSPLIIQAGSQFEKRKTHKTLVEFVDLAPTMLDILGLPAMENIQGESFMPILTGEKTTHKALVYSEFLVDNKAMVRGEEWKYIFTSGKRDLGQGYATGNPPSGILHRLYHLKTDPWESRDVAESPESQTTLAQYQQHLLNWFKETHPKADALPAGLSLDEQLVWFCEPPDEGADLRAQ